MERSFPSPLMGSQISAWVSMESWFRHILPSLVSKTQIFSVSVSVSSLRLRFFSLPYPLDLLGNPPFKRLGLYFKATKIWKGTLGFCAYSLIERPKGLLFATRHLASHCNCWNYHAPVYELGTFLIGLKHFLSLEISLITGLGLWNLIWPLPS